jgi:outer membrane protein assembly factor BamB
MKSNLLHIWASVAIVTLALAACSGGQDGGQSGMLPNGPGQRQAGYSNASTQVDWPTWGFNQQRTGYNPNETILTNKNVSGLTLKWSFPLGTSYTSTQPIVASNVALPNGTSATIVFAGDENGDFYAVRALTGKLLWKKTLGSAIDPSCVHAARSSGVTGSGVIDRRTNRVYVMDGMATLWAFDLATGARAVGFPPLAAYQNPTENHTWSALLLTPDGSTLYYPTASHCDLGTYYGTINAVNTTTRVITTFNLVTNSSQYYGNGVWSWGGESIDPLNGNLYAGVGNSLGALGEDGQYTDSVIELTGALGFVADDQPEPVPTPTATPDIDIGTTPVVYDDQGSCIAFERKDGHFFTVDRTALANGVYGSDLNLGGTLGTPAYDPLTHALYVNVPHGLTKLNIGPNCTASIAWQSKSTGATGYQVPVVANGVVYAAGKTVLYAFNANTGAILWNSGSTISGTIAAAPTVVNGRVYVTAWDGHLYSFAR